MINHESPIGDCLLYIDGKFCPSSDSTTFDLVSPTTLKVVAKVHEASVDDTNAAVAAAKAAFPAWAALSPKERGSYMKKLSALLAKHDDELAHLEAISMGRPIKGYFDAKAAAGAFAQYAEHGYSVKGMSSLNTPGFVNMTFRQPYGVAGAIIPWNVPISTLAGKVAPALAAGNAVVLKSSEKAPLTSFRFAQLVDEAGFPPGVLNLLSGHGQISGNAMATHMDIGVISFTGSLRTGRAIQEASAKSNLKKVILELGGKCPAVVFDDADLDAAVQETKFSAMFNTGQICMANSRIFVQDTIADKFISRFDEACKALKLGDPTDPEVNFGPLADSIQYENVKKYIDIGRQESNKTVGENDYEGTGYYIKPIIFIDAPSDSRIMQEEVFGPVVNINIFKTEEEATKAANNTMFGLYASVYTKNIDRALRMAKALEAGTVSINCASPTKGPDTPFGGYKLSGTGREGLDHSMDEFMETKTVLIKLQQ